MCVHACLCERNNARARGTTCIWTRPGLLLKHKLVVDKNCQCHFIVPHVLLRMQKPPFRFISQNLVIKAGTVCSKCDVTRLRHFLAGCVALLTQASTPHSLSVSGQDWGLAWVTATSGVLWQSSSCLEAYFVSSSNWFITLGPAATGHSLWGESDLETYMRIFYPELELKLFLPATKVMYVAKI